MKRGFVRILTVTAAMVSMLSMSMTVCAAENYTVAEGDHLMKIAQNKYGDKEKWNVIYEANKEAIKEPTKIYPGQVIVIPDLTEAPAALPEAVPAVPEAVPAAPEAVPATPVVAPEVVPAAPVVQPEAVPATETVMTLEEYYKDPEFKKGLDAEMQMFNGYDDMAVSLAFQGNTMAVVVKILDSSYMIDGLDELLNEAMESVRPMVEEMVVMIENELGNPGNCVVIYSYQTADGTTIAQKAFTAGK